MTDWLEDLKADYEDKVAYAVGFNPPPAADDGNDHDRAVAWDSTTRSSSSRN